MNTKKKIRQAFEVGKPDVLPQIMEDCPSNTASAPRKRRKLSERTVEFIATAASLALLIGAVFGGVVYLQGGVGGTLTNPNEGPGVPMASTRPSHMPGLDSVLPPYTTDTIPGNTLPPYTDHDGMILRTDDILYPLELRDAPYVLPDVEVEDITVDDYRMYRIVREYDGCRYEFLFDGYTSRLTDINVLDNGGEDPTRISQWVAAQMAALDLDPNLYGYNIVHYSKVDCALNGDKTQWQICIERDSQEFIYFLDLYTGEVLERLSHDIHYISLVQARDIALEMLGHELSQVRALKVGMVDQRIEVYYEYGDYIYTYLIDARTGQVIYDHGAKESYWDDSFQIGAMTWEKARDLCLVECGVELYDLIAFSWNTFEYETGPCYLVDLHFENYGSYSYRVDANTGKFLQWPIVEIPTPTPPDGALSEADALQFAAANAGARVEDLTEISFKTDKSVEGNYCYWVYFTIGDKDYEVQVHMYTGEILSVQTNAD